MSNSVKRKNGSSNTDRKRRVLWVGDAVENTGFARCTHAVCDALQESGLYEVVVLGLNYWGDPHGYKYPIYPCVNPIHKSTNHYGSDRIDQLAKMWNTDIIVMLCDPWMVEGYVRALSDEVRSKNTLIAWLAVDGKNQKAETLNELDYVITWTNFALDELRLGGYEGKGGVVPLGVNKNIFYPSDSRAIYRSNIEPQGIPVDGFLVGVAGRNQYPRKRLDLAVAYFAQWVKGYGIDDAYLFCHCAPTGERGYDLLGLAKYFGVENRIKLTRPSYGNVGTDLTDEQLHMFYNCLDCYMTTTQGEGWGLPAHEAMACGVPVVAPNWSGLGDWAKDYAHLVPCNNVATTAPMNTMTYVLGGIADPDEFAQALHKVYIDWGGVQPIYPRSCIEFAHSLNWQNTQKLFLAELDKCL